MSGAVFSGVMTALATPFIQGGAIDVENFMRLLRVQKAAGIHGVIIAGTTGESPCLSDEERACLVRLALAEQCDTFRIYVGTGSNSTRESVKTSEFFAELRHEGRQVDGVMVVVPYYNKPSQAGLVEHFSAIARAVPQTSVCLYNVPGRAGVTLLPATLVKLAANHANIVAIKEAAGDLNVITQMRNALNKAGRPEFSIVSGDDATFPLALVAGANGVISVSSHVIPWSMLEILEAYKRGDLPRLRELHLLSHSVNTGLFIASNPIPLKWVLAHQGFGDGSLRLPMVSLDENLVPSLREMLEQAKKNGLRICAP